MPVRPSGTMRMETSDKLNDGLPARRYRPGNNSAKLSSCPSGSVSLHPMARIHIIDPENSPPIPDWRPSDKDGTSFQAGECRTLAAIYTSSKRSLRHRCRNLVKKPQLGGRLRVTHWEKLESLP